MKKRLCITKAGKVSMCSCPEGKFGRGRCNHVSVYNEETNSLSLEDTNSVMNMSDEEKRETIENSRDFTKLAILSYDDNQTIARAAVSKFWRAKEEVPEYMQPDEREKVYNKFVKGTEGEKFKYKSMDDLMAYGQQQYSDSGKYGMSEDPESYLATTKTLSEVKKELEEKLSELKGFDKTKLKVSLGKVKKLSSVGKYTNVIAKYGDKNISHIIASSGIAGEDFVASLHGDYHPALTYGILSNQRPGEEVSELKYINNGRWEKGYKEFIKERDAKIFAENTVVTVLVN